MSIVHAFKLLLQVRQNFFHLNLLYCVPTPLQLSETLYVKMMNLYNANRVCIIESITLFECEKWKGSQIGMV